MTPDVDLNTPIGRLKTLYLVKERREPGESSAELWVSAQHHHFPVRLITVQRNGLRFEQMIQTLDIRESGRSARLRLGPRCSAEQRDTHGIVSCSIERLKPWPPC